MTELWCWRPGLNLLTSVVLLFEPRDLWVGVFWDHQRFGGDGQVWRLRVYVCLIPCLPLRLTWGPR